MSLTGLCLVCNLEMLMPPLSVLPSDHVPNPCSSFCGPLELSNPPLIFTIRSCRNLNQVVCRNTQVTFSPSLIVIKRCSGCSSCPLSPPGLAPG
jgi:hypothetical protein